MTDRPKMGTASKPKVNSVQIKRLPFSPKKLPSKEWKSTESVLVKEKAHY